MPKPGITENIRVRSEMICMNGNCSCAIIGMVKEQPPSKWSGAKMLILGDLKRWDYKTSVNDRNKRSACASTVKQSLFPVQEVSGNSWNVSCLQRVKSRRLSQLGCLGREWSTCPSPWVGAVVDFLLVLTLVRSHQSRCHWPGSSSYNPSHYFGGVRIFQCSPGPRVDVYGPEAQKRNKSTHLALCQCCRPLSSFLFPK